MKSIHVTLNGPLCWCHLVAVSRYVQGDSLEIVEVATTTLYTPGDPEALELALRNTLDGHFLILSLTESLPRRSRPE
jgi:hypothetical protein